MYWSIFMIVFAFLWWWPCRIVSKKKKIQITIDTPSGADDCFPIIFFAIFVPFTVLPFYRAPRRLPIFTVLPFYRFTPRPAAFQILPFYRFTARLPIFRFYRFTVLPFYRFYRVYLHQTRLNLKADPAPAQGIAGTRKQERKEASRLTMLHSNGFVKVSSATLTQI